ncbi:hypothetical protein ABRP70_09240 [Pectobacterium odoriferum]|uniref:hypothetical protein n=1 Tax=Pectobacterium TaxID=122277 RepID=UPI001CE1BD96|nr:hypothetical protein [Pectobacterium versatile]MCA5929952.1 hypothetical protein [Pectobacterium versatile]MCA5947148.1 hypothetical protein [Pectobacterium versatile]MCA5951564.1 hypothetical protein [Pectobacterium versatile]UCP86689.1 hypothetical protein LGL96_03385 [Pectobacterium versatile]
MCDVTQQEIGDELERAQLLKQTAEEFIDIAEGINNTTRDRLEEERDIGPDSNRWVSLDDIPLGEEALRVKEEQSNIDTVIQLLEDIAEGKIPAADVVEKFQEVVEDLNSIEGTLQDVSAEEVIKASQKPNDDDFYHGHDEEFDEGEDE